MRLTGGYHCGRRIHVPKGLDVRPTQDRVRESVFGSLAAVIGGARFLDLYAGSGAVGLEALSRGAADVVWVESGRRAHQALVRNVTEIGGTSAGTVVLSDVRRFVARPPAAPYDIVYMDPPYGDTDLGGVLAALVQGGWLSADALLLVETACNETVPCVSGLTPVGEKRYGRTKVTRLARGQ